MSPPDQHPQPIGEMFSAANTKMPTTPQNERGFTPSNIQQPAPAPLPTHTPDSGQKFQGSFTPSSIIMPSVNPKPTQKPEGKK